LRKKRGARLKKKNLDRLRKIGKEDFVDKLKRRRGARPKGKKNFENRLRRMNLED
jgi:hypothetical protein